MIRKAFSLRDRQHRRLASAASGDTREEADMTSVEPIEIEELCGRVLGMISARTGWATPTPGSWV